MVFSLLIALLPILYHTIVTADNTTDYIQHLEKEISDLKTHNQATEQKQAAVLASILSKLQAQEEKIQELTDEHENSTADSNSTVATNGGLQVAFEAFTASATTSSRVYFKKETLNVGGGYDAERGSFSAPRTGIYQFWFSVYVSARQQQFASHSNMIVLKAGSSSYGGQMSPLPASSTHQGSQSFVTRLVQGLHIVPLTHGDTVYVEHKSHGSVTQESVFSGILLR